MSKLALSVKNVYHSFGDKKVLNNVNVEIFQGEIVAVVGPSGCGKSTLLKAILGTDPPERGEIFAGNKLICGPNRDVGIVYQHYPLYDFLTAKENVAFGLKLDETNFMTRMCRPFFWNKKKKEHHELAQTYLEKMGLGGSGHLYPNKLSGGMRQRVAIAQSLIMRPKVLLLDEPFGALDEQTREDLQKLVLKFREENSNNPDNPPYTMLIVTHELYEALLISDRVIGLSQYHADGKNGSTIVYDKSSPIYNPNSPTEFEAINKQKEELRTVVFPKKS